MVRRDPLEDDPPPEHGRRSFDCQPRDPNSRIDAELQPTLASDPRHSIRRNEHEPESDGEVLPPEPAWEGEERVGDDRDKGEEDVQRSRD